MMELRTSFFILSNVILCFYLIGSKFEDEKSFDSYGWKENTNENGL